MSGVPNLKLEGRHPLSRRLEFDPMSIRSVSLANRRPRRPLMFYRCTIAI
jgi:hypothetical protein